MANVVSLMTLDEIAGNCRCSAGSLYRSLGQSSVALFSSMLTSQGIDLYFTYIQES